ncbi:MAG: FtsW/RodA/SpoVE family cell cycle protein [Bacteroidetes bacterium]|nr:FtsW/RodA/SpoVE family cell cycle protein [Bacteroidota bacterium]MCY4234154.1 FtsW/RodA/SpoVE family cell cycle protein [Bacteroidota bacterium]
MRSWYRNLDLPALCAWIGLCSCGLVAIYSSTHGEAQEFLLNTVQDSFQRQILWLIISSVALAIVLTIPLEWLVRFSPLVYAITIGLLIAALIFGREVSGARSWVYLGPLSIQSSELAKVGAILMASYLFTLRFRNNPVVFGTLIAATLLLPASLIILQNDLGTALVFFGMLPILWLCTGVPLRVVGLVILFPITGYLAVISWQIAVGFTIAVGVIALFGTRSYKWMTAGVMACALTIGTATFALNYVLQPHQVARIVSFSNPEADEFRAGVGFHLVQSKAALGSGGLWGHGFQQGSQTQGRYIPEQSTDFVFSVVGEEWGFVGSVVVLLLFATLMLRLIRLVKFIDHPFGICLIFGAVGIFMIHVCVNLGMVLGLLPVIGIPLPFLSYGGSALLTNTLILGLALSVYMRRAEFSLYV